MTEEYCQAEVPALCKWAANTTARAHRVAIRAEIAGQSAIEALFCAYETALRDAGFLAMGGQFVNATVVAAPKQRNTEAEKAELSASDKTGFGAASGDGETACFRLNGPSRRAVGLEPRTARR